MQPKGGCQPADSGQCPRESGNLRGVKRQSGMIWGDKNPLFPRVTGQLVVVTRRLELRMLRRESVLARRARQGAALRSDGLGSQITW
eukprot:scaffold108432_cov33-Tisochrysis_lutea.AAC.2